MGELYKYSDFQTEAGVWMVGKVSEKHPDYGTLVVVVGSADTYGQFAKGNTRFARFRTKTKGRTWPETGFETPPKNFYHSEIQRFHETLSTFDSDSLPSELIQSLRGDFYYEVCSIMQESVGSSLLPAALTFLREYVKWGVWWLHTTPQRLPELNEVLVTPELAYHTVNHAVASVYPELFDALRMIWRTDPNLKSLFYVKTEEQRQELKRVLREEEVGSVEELMVREFCMQGGLEAVQVFVQGVSGVSVQLLSELPLWCLPAPLSHYIQPLLPFLLHKLLQTDTESLFKSDLFHLQNAISCVFPLSNPEESLHLMHTFFRLVSSLLSSPTLETRINTALFLSSFPLPDPHFTHFYLQLAPQYPLIPFLISDFHPNLLQSSRKYLQFCAKNGLISNESLADMWSAVLQSHESVRFEVIKVMVDLAREMNPENVMFLAEINANVDFGRMDTVFVRFLKDFIENLPENMDEKTDFARIIVSKLSNWENDEAKMRTLVSILQLPAFFSDAQSLFQQHFSSLSSSVESIHFIHLYLSMLLEKGRSLRGLVAPASAMVDACIEAIGRQPEYTSVLLECIDAAAGFEEEVYLGRNQLVRLWKMAGREEGKQWFAFLKRCESEWMQGELARSALKEMDRVGEEMKSALRHLTYDDFIGLARAVLLANSHISLTSDIVGIDLITSAVILMTDSHARAKSISDLTEAFSISAVSPLCITKALNTIISFLSRSESVPGACQLFLHFFDFQDRYKDSFWFEDDLDRAVARLMALESGLARKSEEYVRNKVVQLATDYQVPYFCVIYLKNEFTVEMHSKILTHSLSESQALELIRLVKTNKTWSESLLLWRILTKLMSFGLLKPLYRHLPDFQSSSDFVERLTWLLSISFPHIRSLLHLHLPQLSSQVLKLFTDLNFNPHDPEPILSHYSYKFIVYIDLVVQSMADMHWKQGKELNTDSARKVIGFLLLVSHYFGMENADYELETKIFPASLSIMKSVREDFWTKCTDLPILVVNSLMESRSSSFRNEFCEWINELARCSPNITPIIISELVPLILQIVANRLPNYQVFSLFAKISENCELEIDEEMMDFKEKVISYAMEEDVFWEGDAGLRDALMSCLHALWRYMPNDQRLLVASKIVVWLFEYRGREVGRSTLIAGLNVLSSDCDTMHLTLDGLGAWHKNMTWRRVNKWKMVWDESPVRPYLGIRNIGTICYLSTLFQQLYHIPSLRFTVLSLTPSTRTPVLNSFISLFTDLRFKRRKTVSPVGIVTELQAISANIGDQMDIDEFWKEFMHILSKELTESEQNQLLNRHFFGNFHINFQCKVCNFTRTHEESFYSVLLQITGKSCLSDSLSAYIQGELMTGSNAINCPNCKSPQNTEKSPLFAALPNILIFVLRRFDYNLGENAKYRKINDYFEFREELDMEKYALKGDFEENYYKYRLRGVILHVGTVESGHYYALIKQNEKWMKFDDEKISEVVSFDQESFGSRDAQSSKNAYLLLYERISLLEKDGKTPIFCDLDENLSSFVQEKRRILEKKLEIYYSRQQLMSKEYFEFVQNLSRKTHLTVQIMKFIISYFLTIFLRIESWVKNYKFLENLLILIEKNPSISIWLLEILSCDRIIDEFLLTCPVLSVQKAVVLLLQKGVKCAPEAAVTRCLQRFMKRMGRLKYPRSKSGSGFWEAVYHVIRRLNEEKVDLNEFLERFISNGFQASNPVKSGNFARFSLFSDTAYLGHDLKSAYQPKQTLDATVSVVFHFFILNLLLTSDTLSQVAFALQIELPMRKDTFETHLERRQFCNLIRTIMGYSETKGEDLLYQWIVSLELRNVKQVNGFVEILTLLAGLTEGKILNIVFMGLVNGPLHGKIPLHFRKIWCKSFYSALKSFPESESWSILTPTLQKWQVNADDECWQQLDRLLTRDLSYSVSGVDSEESYYERHVGLGVSLKSRTGKGEVLWSFDIAHVVKMQGRVVWVAGEEDLQAA